MGNKLRSHQVKEVQSKRKDGVRILKYFQMLKFEEVVALAFSIVECDGSYHSPAGTKSLFCELRNFCQGALDLGDLLDRDGMINLSLSSSCIDWSKAQIYPGVALTRQPLSSSLA